MLLCSSSPRAASTVFIFTARRYASAVYPIVMCLSVYPSVVSRYCIKKNSKQLNVGLRKQRRTIAQRLQFSNAKDLGEIPTGSPLPGARNTGGVPGRLKSATFDQCLAI